MKVLLVNSWLHNSDCVGLFWQRVGKGLEIPVESPSDFTNVAYQLMINKNDL